MALLSKLINVIFLLVLLEIKPSEDSLEEVILTIPVFLLDLLFVVSPPLLCICYIIRAGLFIYEVRMPS